MPAIPALKIILKSLRGLAVPCACLFLKSKFCDLTDFDRKSSEAQLFFQVLSAAIYPTG